jgi:hypothetical protein
MLRIAVIAGILLSLMQRQSAMITDVKNPEREHDRTDEAENRPADSAPGTESALKGGSEPAKRQAERDWKDSSKESGE